MSKRKDSAILQDIRAAIRGRGVVICCGFFMIARRNEQIRCAMKVHSSSGNGFQVYRVLQ